MDVNLFSAKSQTLTLTTSSPSLSWLNSTNLRSVRREFLRPPSAATGRKCKKLGLLHYQSQSRSPRLIVKASLGSDSNSVLIVIALTTFSVVSLAIFNHFLKKKKKSKEVKVTDSVRHALSQLGKTVVKDIIESRNVGVGDTYRKTSLRENEYLTERETGQASGEKNGHVQFQEATTMVQQSSVLTETSDSLGDDSPEGSDATAPTHPSHVPPESDVVQPLAFATKMSELQLGKDVNITDLDTELPGLTMDIESSASLVPVNDAHIEMDEQRKSDQKLVEGEINGYHGVLRETVREERMNMESSDSVVPVNDAHIEMGEERKSDTKLVEEDELNGYNNAFRERVREDQFSLYGVNQSVLKSPGNLNGVKAISSHASPFDTFSLLSLNWNVELKGAELSTQESLQISEYVEEKTPLTSHRGGPSYKRKESKDIRGGRGKERRHLTQDDNKNLLQFPYPNGKHANSENYLPDQFSAYNRLLRKERLTDCVDLLEDMERRGLLDMNKVYHARFFNICKSKKAIKEAFRFIKLISSPTLSTFNMLMSVCASSQDSEGAFRVMQLVRDAGLKADCKLYTTLISTCAKSGKVDAMFEVFHEMVNAGVQPNIHTYGALIDGCAKAGQVAKAFGAYGIMRSKNVKPDRVIFNALITGCGQSGAVDRAFDVLAEMRAEVQPVDPDHITIGALIKACAKAGQVDRAQEVYKMMHKFKIKGTPEVYTIAVNCCSQTGDWEFARSVYGDMTSKGVVPDEVFFSALIDAAGHAGKVETAFEILQEAKSQGIRLGIISYSSLMGACSNARRWQKALELYENIKSIKLKPTVSTMNALITALCDGDQLPKALEVLLEMKKLGLCPNIITYSILFVASERKDDAEAGLMLLSQAKEDGVAPNLVMFKCIIGLCLRSFVKARTLGERVLSFDSGRPQIENKWTSQALMIYREAITSGKTPSVEFFSQVLGCLQLPYDADSKNRLVEHLGVTADSSRCSNLCSLIDGFGQYDPRVFSLLEEAASLGIVPIASFKQSPIIVDARKLEMHTAEVYLLTVLKGLKHRLAAGVKLPNITILLPVEKSQTLSKGEKTINLAERITQAITALLRRLGLSYQGNGSYGKIRINGLTLKRWFQPKLASPFTGKPGELSSFRLGKEITYQQRNIRTGNFSLE